MSTTNILVQAKYFSNFLIMGKPIHQSAKCWGYSQLKQNIGKRNMLNCEIYDDCKKLVAFRTRSFLGKGKKMKKKMERNTK